MQHAKRNIDQSIKKACERRVEELHDEELFKEHPPREDCPICFLPLPLDAGQKAFQTCCGKLICKGCIYAMRKEARGRRKIDLCAFCRVPTPTDEEIVRRINKLIEADNAYALYVLASYYARGISGMPQDFEEASELFLKAGELGCAEAYCNLGVSYDSGMGVEVDKKKAKHYYELAAMNGNVNARFNLGCMEGQAGNHHRAYAHFILSAKAGDNKSLDAVKKGFIDGVMTKDGYANILRAHQQRQDEMKSDDRDKARSIL